MRAVIQRVNSAAVEVSGREIAAVYKGILVLLGIEEADAEDDVDWLAGKIVRLRIFDDENGVMNRSVQEIDGDVLIVSQFTLHASTKKGNRPSYVRAMRTELASDLYDCFCAAVARELGKPVKRGEFGAHMDVRLVNNGPVTIIIDTKNRD
jgi:D-tyrosyl-tRNA(Tyr) deacylase